MRAPLTGGPREGVGWEAGTAKKDVDAVLTESKLAV